MEITPTQFEALIQKLDSLTFTLAERIDRLEAKMEGKLEQLFHGDDDNQTQLARAAKAIENGNRMLNASRQALDDELGRLAALVGERRARSKRNRPFLAVLAAAGAPRHPELDDEENEGREREEPEDG